MKKIAFVIFNILVSIIVSSEGRPIQPVQFSEVKNFDGRVLHIHEDQFGFIWFGKESGLFRYDGNDIKTYRFDPNDKSSISGNLIESILEVSNGDLFIGTKGNGLNYFNRRADTFTRYLNDVNDSTTISSNEVKSVCPDSKGNYWIGTDGGGLNLFYPATGKFELIKPKGLTSNKILEVLPDGKGKYWISTFGGGLHLFDPKSKRFFHIGEGTKFAKLNLYCVREVKPGTLWLAAMNDGLIAYDIKKNSFSTIIEKSKTIFIEDIELTNKGEVYVSSFKGLFYFKNSNSKVEILNSIENDFATISDIFIDKRQNVWVGTIEGKIGRISSFRKKFHTFSQSLPFSTNYIYSILSEKNSEIIYFTTPDKIYEFNTFNQNYKSVDLPLLFNYAIINVPGKNSLLLSNTNSSELKIYDKINYNLKQLQIENQSDFEFLNDQIYALYGNDSNDFWVGSTHVAYQITPKLKPNEWKINKVLVTGEPGGISKSHNVSCFLKQSNGDFWVGTSGSGLNWQKKGESRFNHFVSESGNNNSLSNDFIFCLASDKNGNLWIGTQGGLNKYNPENSTFSNVDISDGLADDWIKSINIDNKNRVWVGTRHGISSISNDLKTIQNYVAKDGVPNFEFLQGSVATDGKGVMYFGSKGGMIWFHPDSIKSNPDLAKPEIVNFKINDSKVAISNSSPLKQIIELTNEIILEYKENSFSFQLAALSYVEPKLNRIKYKLEGYDNNWIMAGTSKTAEYFNVRPGTYEFMVMAANEDGVWNPSPRTVKIVIARPFWFSNLALFIYFILITCLVYLYVYRYRQFRSSILSAISNAVLKRYKKHELIEPTPVVIDSADQQFLQKALKFVEENMSDSDFGVEMLCEKMCLSQSQLYRKINNLAGVTVSEFIKEVRLKRAAQLIEQKTANISEIAYLVGFNDPKYFSKCFKQYFGVSPKKYSTPID